MYSIWEMNSFIHYDCIIIGSGILGLSTAISIKEKSPSTEILILERGTLPSGASTKNAGFACFGSLTEILSDIKRNGESETVSLVEKRWKGINMLRQRLGDEKMGLLNYGGSELLKENHIDALDELEHVNHLLRNIFDTDTFIADEKKIGESGYLFMTNPEGIILAHPDKTQILKLDISKARDGLRWGPRWTLAETLERIVAWHRAWASGTDMHDYCNAELERYAAAPLAYAA